MIQMTYLELYDKKTWFNEVLDSLCGFTCSRPIQSFSHFGIIYYASEWLYCLTVQYYVFSGPCSYMHVPEIKFNNIYSFLNLPHFLGTSEYSDSFYIALELTIFVDSLTRPSIVLMDFPNTFSPSSLHLHIVFVSVYFERSYWYFANAFHNSPAYFLVACMCDV